ncbi:MAG: hypothetical protein NVSMB29_14450 [Candidatus Dormibacteria bacterium]
MSREGAEAMALLRILDELEALVTGGRRIPLTQSVAVPEEAALELLDQARSELPASVRQAAELLEGRGTLLSQAQSEAERVVAEADLAAERTVAAAREAANRVQEAAADHARVLVAEHVISRAAEERAASAATEAAAEAARVRLESEDYARQVLERLQAELQRVGETVSEALRGLPAPSSRGGRRPRR